MTSTDHRQALTDLERLVAAMYPSDPDLRLAVARCLATLPPVDPGKPFELPSITPVFGERRFGLLE